MKINFKTDSKKLFFFISSLILFIFILVGYYLIDLIGALLGLATALLVVTYMKNHFDFSDRKSLKEKKDEKSDKTDEFSDLDLKSKKSTNEEESKAVPENIEFEVEEEEFAVGLAPEDGDKYSIEQGTGAGKQQLKEKKIFSSRSIQGRKAIFYDLCIEEIKKSSINDILNLIKNGKNTEEKMEFLESIIWEINDLDICEKFSSLIKIAEKLHDKDMKSGARYLYRNLEMTFKKIDGYLVKSKLFRELAVSYSKIGNIKKSGEYFTKGFKICMKIEEPEDIIYEISRYVKASKSEGFPKLTDSIISQMLNYIKNLDEDDHSSDKNINDIKKEGLKHLLNVLLKTKGSKISNDSIKMLETTLNEIKIKEKQELFERLINIAAKEGFVDIYERLSRDLPEKYDIPFELLYEIPYERIGRYITIESGLEESLDYKRYVPYDYEGCYNQGLIKGLIERGNLTESYQYILDMDVIDDNELYYKLIDKTLEKRKVKFAKKIVLKHRLTQVTESIVLEMIEEGNIQEAKDLGEKLQFENTYKIDIETALDMGKQGKFIKSRHLFEDIEERISGIENLDKKIDSYIRLAEKMNITLNNDDSLDILKKCIYFAEDIDKIARIYGKITTCGYEKEAFQNALNIKDKKNRSKILERMGIDIICSLKEIPKGIIKLVQTAEKQDHDIEKERKIFEKIAISLVEGEDHIDQIFKIREIYKEITEHTEKKDISNQEKLKSIASWAKIKRKEIKDQE